MAIHGTVRSCTSENRKFQQSDTTRVQEVAANRSGTSSPRSRRWFFVVNNLISSFAFRSSCVRCRSASFAYHAQFTHERKASRGQVPIQKVDSGAKRTQKNQSQSSRTQFVWRASQERAHHTKWNCPRSHREKTVFVEQKGTDKVEFGSDGELPKSTLVLRTGNSCYETERGWLVRRVQLAASQWSGMALAGKVSVARSAKQRYERVTTTGKTQFSA